MKKGTTVREDEEQKRAKRAEKQRARMQKHVVVCPHCGGDALDHMTKCPHCGGELTPLGYRPMDEKLRKKWKIAGYVFGAAAVVAVIVALVVLRS